MIRVTKAYRRGFGILCLVAAVALLVLGDRKPGGQVGEGVGFMAYWLLCFLCCVLAMIVAWWDLRALRREVREEQRALLDHTLRQLGRPERREPPEEDGEGSS